MSEKKQETTAESLSRLLADFEEDGVHVDLTEWAVDVLSHITTIKTNYYERQKFKKQFTSLTTNEDRIKFCFNNELINDKLYDVVDEMVAHQSRAGKDVARATKYRNEGNKKFAKKNYREALKDYTEAIILAPHDDKDSSLALAYGNRSAALFHLEQYSHSLADIEQAEKYKYPADLVHKLFVRKAKCLKIAGRLSDARSALNNALAAVEVLTLDTAANEDEGQESHSECGTEGAKTKGKDWDKVLKEIKDLMANLEVYGNFIKQKTTENFLSGKITRKSSDLPNAAASVRLERSQRKGRLLVAASQIESNADLICEYPTVALLDKEKYNSHCYTCLKKLNDVAHPCPKCSRVRFCSVQCSTEEKGSAHLKECDFVGLLDMTEKPRLALKLLLEVGLDEALQAYKSFEVKPFSPKFAGDYNSVLTLLDHADKFPFLNSLAFALLASFYVILLRDELKLIPQKDNLTAITCGALLLKHVQQLVTNSIAVISQEQTETGVKMHGDKVGVALYPTVSLLNHSCRPNTAMVFDGAKATARAVRKINFAEELTGCYGPNEDSNYTKFVRRRELKKNYFFDCDCPACGDASEIFKDALVCPSCKGPVMYNEDDFSYKCDDCGSSELDLDVKTIVEKITQYVSAFDSATKLVEMGLKEAVGDPLLSCHDWFDQNLHPLNRKVIRAKQEVSKYHESCGDLKKAIEFGKDAAERLKATAGAESAEYIASLLHVTYLRWKSSEESKVKEEEKAVNDDSHLVIENARKLVQKLEQEGQKYLSIDFEKFHQEFTYISERMYHELKL